MDEPNKAPTSPSLIEDLRWWADRQEGNPTPWAAGLRRLLRQAADTLAQPAILPRWQPIETAPKDQPILLGYGPLVWIGQFDIHKATHWMPLPQSPDSSQGKP